MKKIILLTIISAVIILILAGVLIFVSAKNHEPNPAVGDGIKVFEPELNWQISSPLKITGEVSGNGWAGFEGQVGTVDLLDGNGQIVTRGILTATTEWMNLPTNFETTLNFATPETSNGILIFKNENASGMPEKNKSFSLPIKFSKEKTIEVSVFFGNLSLSSSGEQDECRRVYKTNRYIPKTQAVAQAAINELLRGVTDSEMLAGFFTSIPAGSKLNSISIVDGAAKADFNETIESGGGSCSMAARVAQIEQTLMQFPTIKSVKLSVNGRTEDIFQP